GRPTPIPNVGSSPVWLGSPYSTPNDRLGLDQIDRCCSRTAATADWRERFAAASPSVACAGGAATGGAPSESVAVTSRSSLRKPSTACKSSSDDMSVKESAAA